jgi:hypothetical protein
MGCQALVCNFSSLDSAIADIFLLPGKTVLASMVIEQAKRLPGATVAFAYCKHYDEPKNKGFLHVAKAFLSQLVLRHEELIPHFYEKLSESGQDSLSADTLAKPLLEVALKGHKAVYLVIDGLDEYSRDDRKEICSWYRTIVADTFPTDPGSLRCLFISQEDGAKRDLSDLAQLKLTPKHTITDIRAFCASRHKRIEQKFGILSKEQNITNVITARAKGV